MSSRTTPVKLPHRLQSPSMARHAPPPATIPHVKQLPISHPASVRLAVHVAPAVRVGFARARRQRRCRWRWRGRGDPRRASEFCATAAVTVERVAGSRTAAFDHVATWCPAPTDVKTASPGCCCKLGLDQNVRVGVRGVQVKHDPQGEQYSPLGQSSEAVHKQPPASQQVCARAKAMRISAAAQTKALGQELIAPRRTSPPAPRSFSEGERAARPDFDRRTCRASVRARASSRSSSRASP